MLPFFNALFPYVIVYLFHTFFTLKMPPTNRPYVLLQGRSSTTTTDIMSPSVSEVTVSIDSTNNNNSTENVPTVPGNDSGSTSISSALATIALEKSMCFLLPKKGDITSSLFSNKKSATWQHCRVIDCQKMTKLFDNELPPREFRGFDSISDYQALLDDDSSGLHEIKTVLSDVRKNPQFAEKNKAIDQSAMLLQRVVVCEFCFNDPKCNLKQSLQKLHNGNASNLGKHIVKRHKDELEKADGSNKRKAETTSGSVSNKMSKSSNNFPMSFSVSMKNAHLEEFEDSVATFFNDCGIAVRNVANPKFRTMLENASTYLNHPSAKVEDLTMGVHRINTVNEKSRIQMNDNIADIVSLVRLWYLHYTGIQQKFISICHDIWDGKRRNLLGISIMFISPCTMTLLKISVGLVEAKNKKAVDIAAKTLEVLRRYGIVQADLYRPVNDTTNSAKKAGQLIVGCSDKGTCGMHQCELIMKHATGQVTRSRQSVVVDSFTELDHFRKKMKKFCSWMMEGKSKDRFMKYNDYLKSQANTTGGLVLALPNDTRVAGTVLMYQSMLRSYYDLTWYLQSDICPVAFKNLQPTPAEWQLVAEVEAVLRSTQVLSIALQTNMAGAVSISPMLVAYTMNKVTCKSYWIQLMQHTSPTHTFVFFSL